jgi:hypothetical protein
MPFVPQSVNKLLAAIIFIAILTAARLVKNLAAAFYEIRKFITVFTTVYHWILF